MNNNDCIGSMGLTRRGLTLVSPNWCFCFLCFCMDLYWTSTKWKVCTGTGIDLKEKV